MKHNYLLIGNDIEAFIQYVKERDIFNQEEQEDNWYNPDGWTLSTYKEEVDSIKEFTNLNDYRSRFYDFTGQILDEWNSVSSYGDYQEYYIIYKEDNIISLIEDIKEVFDWAENDYKEFIDTCPSKNSSIFILKKH